MSKLHFSKIDNCCTFESSHSHSQFLFLSANSRPGCSFWFPKDKYQGALQLGRQEVAIKTVVQTGRFPLKMWIWKTVYLFSAFDHTNLSANLTADSFLSSKFDQTKYLLTSGTEPIILCLHFFFWTTIFFHNKRSWQELAVIPSYDFLHYIHSDHQCLTNCLFIIVLRISVIS